MLNIKTQDLLLQKIPDDFPGVTIAISIPGAGEHVFTGIRYFQIFIEEEVEAEQFSVKELHCINQEFETAVYSLVLRRLSEIVKP